MKPIKAGKFVFDFSIYPRASVDEQHVNYLVEALRSGAELPPVIAEERTYRLVDGWHRVRAYIKFYGPEHPIECILKRYSSDGDLLMDAIRYNATHGRRMSTFDRAHAAIAGEGKGVVRAKIAEAMAVTVEYLDKILVDRLSPGKIQSKRIQAPNGSPVAPSIGTRIALKNTIRWKAGQELTENQWAINKKLGGMHQLFYVNQLVMLIEADLLDKSNEPLLEKLVHLKGLLNKESLKIAEAVETQSKPAGNGKSPRGSKGPKEGTIASYILHALTLGPKTIDQLTTEVCRHKQTNATSVEGTIYASLRKVYGYDVAKENGKWRLG